MKHLCMSKGKVESAYLWFRKHDFPLASLGHSTRVCRTPAKIHATEYAVGCLYDRMSWRAGGGGGV